MALSGRWVGLNEYSKLTRHSPDTMEQWRQPCACPPDIEMKVYYCIIEMIGGK
jgi:hypothetical protein